MVMQTLALLRRPPRSVLLPVGFVLAGCALVSHWVGSWLLMVSAAGSGVIGLFGIGVLISGTTATNRSRQMVGIAITLWGVGQLISITIAGTAVSERVTVGDLIQGCAVPFVVLTIMYLPRLDTEPLNWMRLLAEVGLVACLNLTALLELRQGQVPAPQVLITLAELMFAAVMLLGSLRMPSPGLVAGAFAAAMLLVAEMRVLQDDWIEVRQALLPIAMAVAVIASRRDWAVPTISAEHAVLVEWRQTLASIVLICGPLTVLAVLAAQGRASSASLVILGCAALFFVKEILSAWQARAVHLMLVRQARTDQLTGLGNRRALTDQLDENGGCLHVLGVDVDKFKDVNTHLGHTAGDQVLVQVADTLRQVCADAGAVPYRVGGDEFVVVSRGSREVVADIARRIRNEAKASLSQMDRVRKLGLTVSVGISDRTTGTGALTAAAEALRVAKQERDTVQWYTPELAERLRRRAELEERLRLAVGEGRIEAHFQPVVDLRDGQVIGLEALARWVDADLGVVSPADFVPVAEQAGLITRMGLQIIERALAVATQYPSYSVAVNVSPLQLHDPRFVPGVRQLLDASDVDPAQLILEVTEGIFMDPQDEGVAVLHRLTDAGVSIAIDDFGSGYSSLGYMSRLPVDVIKVDQSLTRRVAESRTRAVVASIVQMCSSLGLRVVMEGVETLEVAVILRDLGAEYGQGWLWSPAVPARSLPAVTSAVPDPPQQFRQVVDRPRPAAS